MTWGEWITSKYNTIGLTIKDSGSVFKVEEGYLLYLLEDGCADGFVYDSYLVNENLSYSISYGLHSECF